jgi:hypothetical protein
VADSCERGYEPSGSGAIPFVRLSPNVVVEWLMILFSIREVPGSNLGAETGYPEICRGFPQSIKCRDTTLN